MKTHQAAVEWLIERISPYITDDKAQPLIEQAKEIERSQRIRDYNVGYLDAKCNHVQDAESYLVEQKYLASKSAI